MTPMSRAVRTGSRFRLLALVPVVCGALALAPTASAALTSPWTTCEATTLAAFTTCLNNLGTTAGKVANEIIVLNPKAYLPTSFITIPSGVNVEITGSGNDTATGEKPAWNESGATLSGLPTLNGSQENTGAADVDFITVPASSNLVLKGLNIEQGAPSGWAVIRDYGNVEVDNVSFISDGATDIALAQDPSSPNPASAVVNNSSLSEGSGDAIETDSTSTASLYNSDVVGNTGGGVDGNANIVNTLVAGNTPQDCGNGFSMTLTATTSIDDDGTCAGIAGSGVTTDSLTSLKLGSDNGSSGGPTYSIALGSGSTAIGQGTSCLPADQRFYVTANLASCDVGAYQSTGSKDTSTPTCPAAGTSAVTVSTNSNGVQQEAATITPPTEGLGLDSVTGYTLTNTGGFTPGTVSWNTVTGNPFSGATNWDETSPGATEPDWPSRSAPFTLTATKFSSGDNVSGDTHWSFPLTDWAGQTTTCS